MFHRMIRPVVVCGLAVIAGATLGAQRPSPTQSQTQGQTAGARPSEPAGQQAPRAQFRASVELVTQDVIVRDARGQFVADLKPKDFTVLEDGVTQDIVSMVLVHGGRTYNELAAPPPPPQEGIILPPSRPTNDAAGRIFLIFVDDLHLDFQNTGRIRQLFKKIEKDLIHEGDMFGIVSTGPSSLSVQLTYDRSRLDEAIKKISGNGLKPSDIIQGPESAEGPTEVRYRAHVAFSTAYDIMKNLAQVHNRRKAFIYVSNGYDFNPFPKARSGTDPIWANSTGGNPTGDPNQPVSDTNPFEQQGQQFAEADLARELAELTREANRANATIYTIDPRGLVGGPDLNEQVDPTEWYNYIQNSTDSLRVLAEQTGGIAVVNQNNFDKALQRIDAETSDYYVLGYYSTNPDPLKRTRRIEVKVDRPDATVWFRKSYTLPPRPGRSGH
jgi:VWFA-related protein